MVGGWRGLDGHVMARAGSVWIFQFQFDSVQFSISILSFGFSVSVFAHHRDAGIS